MVDELGDADRGESIDVVREWLWEVARAELLDEGEMGGTKELSRLSVFTMRER